jgi:2-C-methyl-D-erythritol 2,4-cyclodiphosphate synthase
MTTGLRVGHGFDVHEFMAGDHVVLAGVRIAHTQGVKAHSDGDVVIHALCDALLGAAALGDIGMHFPDSDPVWKGADSRRFLRHVKHLLAQKRYLIVNVDITVLAEAPRLGSHRDAMKANLADDLALSPDCVNIKATTTEKLGFIGRREGLAAHAVALIELG